MPWRVLMDAHLSATDAKTNRILVTNMRIFEATNPNEVEEMLGTIPHRQMVLPDFQRDFVWDPSATQELIVSIAYNYPAGSILRVRDTERSFAAREFQGAPELGDAIHTFLVLDGQQRLTSL